MDEFDAEREKRKVIMHNLRMQADCLLPRLGAQPTYEWVVNGSVYRDLRRQLPIWLHQLRN